MYKLKSLSSVGLLFAASFFVGCDKDKPETSGRIPVNLTSNIASSSLKVTNDQWEAADRVGLYMKKAGQPLAASGAVYSDATNVQMSISGGTLNSNPQLMYPATGNVDFVAYHPYTASVDANFTIPVNVAGQATGLPVEVLYTNNVVNQAPTASAVTLNFLYSLAKLELTVTGDALKAADFAGMTATIEGMFTQARLQLADGTFTGHQAKQTITLHKTGSNATSATFEALVLPVNVTAGDVSFVFNAGGEKYRIKPAESYAAATSYALEFKLEPGATASLNKAVIIPRNTTPRSYSVLPQKDEWSVLFVVFTNVQTCVSNTITDAEFEGIRNFYIANFETFVKNAVPKLDLKITVVKHNDLYYGSNAEVGYYTLPLTGEMFPVLESYNYQNYDGVITLADLTPTEKAGCGVGLGWAWSHARYGTVMLIQQFDDEFFKEAIVHEWMHGLEWWFASLGYTVPNLHDAGSYDDLGVPGWWYRAYLSNTLTGGPATGIHPDWWQYSPTSMKQ